MYSFGQTETSNLKISKKKIYKNAFIIRLVIDVVI